MTPMNTEPSMSELPATELEAIKQRCEKATSGPWVRDTTLSSVPFVKTKRGRVLMTHAGIDGLAWNDCDFTASARTDIPKLLTYIEHLKRAILELREANIYNQTAGTDDEPDWVGMIAELTKQRDTLTAELASAKADTARLDWWDRERPLTHNELRTGHIVLAMEDGCSEGRTIRQATDAAIASGEGKHE